MSNTATAIRTAEALEAQTNALAAQVEAIAGHAHVIKDVRVDLIAALDRLTSAVEAQTRTLGYIESALTKRNGGL